MSKAKNDGTEKPKRQSGDGKITITDRHILILMAIGAFLFTIITGSIINRNNNQVSNPGLPEVPVISILPTMTPSPLLTSLLNVTVSGSELREQENVIHLAYLQENTGVIYGQTSILWSHPAWEPNAVAPSGLSNLSMNLTEVTLIWKGETYHLNVYQPFVLQGQANMVYLITLNGSILQMPADQNNLTDLATARAALPLTLRPNPHLNLSF